MAIVRVFLVRHGRYRSDWLTGALHKVGTVGARVRYAHADQHLQYMRRVWMSGRSGDEASGVGRNDYDVGLRQRRVHLISLRPTGLFFGSLGREETESDAVQRGTNPAL